MESVVLFCPADGAHCVEAKAPSGRIAAAADHRIAARSGLISVPLGRRAEGHVVEQVDLREDPQVVADVDLGRQAQAHVGARVRVVVAGLEVLRLARRIAAAERDLVRAALDVVYWWSGGWGQSSVPATSRRPRANWWNSSARTR
jgi:hypothetical protein